MATPTRGTPIALGDGSKKRTLRYTWDAMERLEEASGSVGLLDVINRVQRLSFRTLRFAIWAGLLHAEPDLTVERVGELLSESGGRKNMQNLATTVVEAITHDQFSDKDDKDDKGEGASEGGKAKAAS